MWLFYLLVGLSIYFALVFFSVFDKENIPEQYTNQKGYYYVSLAISLILLGSAFSIKKGWTHRFLRIE